MKKIVVVLLLVSMLISMTGCSLAAELIANAGLGFLNSVAPDYEQPDREFHFAEISFVLTEAFSEISRVEDSYAGYISYSVTGLTVFRYAHSSVSWPTATEYAESYKEELSLDASDAGVYEYSAEDVVTDGDVAYFVLSYTSLGNTTSEFISVYVNDYATYVFAFASFDTNLETYRPYLIKWATSVKTVSSPSEI